MGFLYKHYEKIILAVFLLVFVFALVYLIMVFSLSKEITPEDLNIDPEGENYTRIFDEKGNEDLPDGQKGQFSFEEDLKEEIDWVPSNKRNPDSIDFSDFMVPYKGARCEKCFKVIPKVGFEQKLCPICKKDPGRIVEEVVIKDEDTDKDGMLDSFEKKIPGMNFEDPNDAWTDLDGDGYPNLLEHNAETKLDDAKSHPPIADRLSLIGIKRTLLPIKLVNVDKRGSDDKKEWLLTIKILNKRGRLVTEFKKIGDIVDLDGRRPKQLVYKIIDAEIKKEEFFDKSLNMPTEKNVSEIKIQDPADAQSDPVIVVVNQTAYENRARLGFLDTVSNKKHVMKDGDKFTAGDEKVGTEEYQVMEIHIDTNDPDKEWVKIQDSNKRQFEIGKESKLRKTIKEATNTGAASGPEVDPNNYIDPNFQDGNPDKFSPSPVVPDL